MANVKPGRAKDNARANVDVPKRKSAKGTATPANTRPTSAADVWAAMETLLGHRRVLNLQSKTAAKRLRSIESRELSEAERAYWTRARAEADDALRGLDARIKTRKRAPMSDEGRAEAWRVVVALGLRLVTNFDQERTDASALREELERLCGNPPKSTEHGRAALIVQETIRAISKGDDKFVDKLRGKGKRDREDSLLERLEQWRRRLRKSGSSTLPRH